MKRVTTEAPHVTNAWADANKSSRRPSSDERNDEVPGDERDSSSPSTRPSPPSRKTDETVAPINRSGNELAMFAGGDHVNVGVKVGERFVLDSTRSDWFVAVSHVAVS